MLRCLCVGGCFELGVVLGVREPCEAVQEASSVKDSCVCREGKVGWC